MRPEIEPARDGRATLLQAATEQIESHIIDDNPPTGDPLPNEAELERCSRDDEPSIDADRAFHRLLMEPLGNQRSLSRAPGDAGALTDRRIIDAHHHVWDLTVRPQPWISGAYLTPLARSFSTADLAGEARPAGVVGTIVVQTVCVAGETPELLALAAGDDLIAGVVGWTDLTAPDVADAIVALRALPGGDRLVGLRHQVQEEPDPRWLLRPDVLRGLTAVAEAGLVYDLVVTPHQIDAAADAAARLTGLTFVLDHLGKPPIAGGDLAAWTTSLRRLAALPNTVGKLSGLVTEAAAGNWRVEDLRLAADTALDAFGPGRLLFGSDWPVCTLEADYRRVVEIADSLTDGLRPAEKTAVFHDNASRVYTLR